MIYVLLNEDGSIRGVTPFVSNVKGTRIEVADDFFIDYPQDCWFIDENNNVMLKENADEIKQAFLDSLNPPEPVVDEAIPE